MDHDRSNNDPSNLAVAHEGCHLSYHNKNRVWSDESRKKISDANRRRYSDPSQREKQSAKMKQAYVDDPDYRNRVARPGHDYSEETRAKVRRTQSSRKPCSDCGRLFNPTWMTRHKIVGRCAG